MTALFSFLGQTGNKIDPLIWQILESAFPMPFTCVIGGNYICFSIYRLIGGHTYGSDPFLSEWCLQVSFSPWHTHICVYIQVFFQEVYQGNKFVVFIVNVIQHFLFWRWVFFAKSLAELWLFGPNALCCLSVEKMRWYSYLPESN